MKRKRYDLGTDRKTEDGSVDICFYDWRYSVFEGLPYYPSE